MLSPAPLRCTVGVEIGAVALARCLHLRIASRVFVVVVDAEEERVRRLEREREPLDAADHFALPAHLFGGASVLVNEGLVLERREAARARGQGAAGRCHHIGVLLYCSTMQ